METRKSYELLSTTTKAVRRKRERPVLELGQWEICDEVEGGLEE